jgi:HPt (histidine-containing phosphotransfer) domain-containing protein
MNDFEDRLASLRTRFRARLAADVAWMEQTVAHQPTASQLKELGSRAHKLAGISGSLGFPEIALAAKPLDREWTLTSEQVDEVRSLVAAMRAACCLLDA